MIRLTRYSFSLIILALICISSNVNAQAFLETETGKASWYGKKFDGRKTASGEKFNSDYPTAAHPSWPFGTVVKVTNLTNDRSIKVRINDRGPTRAVRSKGVIMDVTLGVAKVLGFVKRGLTDVRVDVIKWGKE